VKKLVSGMLLRLLPPVAETVFTINIINAYGGNDRYYMKKGYTVQYQQTHALNL